MSQALTASAASERTLRAKLVRYTAASAAGTVSGQSALIFLSAVMDWPGVAANLTAVTFGAVPNYLVNRAWTWQRRDRHSWSREVLPFWVMTLFGLVLSTIFVAYADHRWGTTLAISLANMTGFGVLWVAKFVLLDRVLFHRADVHAD